MNQEVIIELSPQNYDGHKKDCDGICSLCRTWHFGAAEPEATNVYCPECENRSVFGIKAALIAGVITVH